MTDSLCSLTFTQGINLVKELFDPYSSEDYKRVFTIPVGARKTYQQKRGGGRSSSSGEVSTNTESVINEPGSASTSSALAFSFSPGGSGSRPHSKIGWIENLTASSHRSMISGNYR